jgi:tetratricopeptide (TPR) repeat protein
MHNFPEAVAKELRKAIYYDKGYGRDPKKAFQYYKEAIMVATDLGMNPYSEEFIGMRIRMAEFLEEHRQIEAAITVLERERGFAYEWLEKVRERLGEGVEIPDRQWARMVGLAVKLGVKLGKLYSDEDIEDPETAQAAFILAVETLLKERIRREQQGVKEEAREFLNEEEVGAALEELGHSYLDTRQPEFALPLFLQALSLSPSKSCHTAMLSTYRISHADVEELTRAPVNQVSAAVSQQNPAIAAQLSQTPKGKSRAKLPTAADLQQQAKQWAEKALAMAQSIPAPERTEECDVACAVTTHNLAELAHVAGDDVTAKRLFQEAKTLSKAIGFEDGIKEAEIALKRFQVPIKA